MEKSVIETRTQNGTHGRSYHIDGSYACEGMSESMEKGTIVSVFLADATRMGCELMATALRCSRYKLAPTGYATDSIGICAWLRENEVDVVIISADLKEGATVAFNVTREIKASYPKTNVIMMLESIDRVRVIEAFRAGAAGIFTRDKSFDLLCKCIQVVHQGQIWADNNALRFLVDAFVRSKPAGTISPKRSNLLTKREEGVVQLVADGLTNRDISQQLNLSENTVRNYLFRIFNKVGTSNRLELALYSMRKKKEERQEILIEKGSLAAHK
jgi:two-component system, NarL family, nitrate/nitrite response regulator NarL